ncbi:MAG TPA: hypothetical protein VFW33_11880, partial [Gemmataceae bacterium]|nr:hypothetical protein [Gemmataceae bacterium]
ERPSSRDLIAEAVESGVDLAAERRAASHEAEAIDVEAADSSIDLGAAASKASPSSAPEAVPERRAAPGSHHEIDLGAEPEETERVELAPEADEETAVVEAMGRGPGSSGVDLGGTAGRPPKRGIPESSSAIDMERGAPAEAAPDEDDEAAAAATLGDEDEEEPAPAKGKPKKPAAAEEDEDEEAASVLAGTEDETRADEEEEAVPARARRRAAAEAEEEEEEAAAPAAAEEDEEDEAPAKAEDEEEEPTTKKPTKARAGAGCLVLAGVLGLLLGVVVPTALAMFDVFDLGKEMGSLVGITPKKTNPVVVGPGAANQGGPNAAQGAAPAPADAGSQLRNGDFAAALKGMEAAGGASPTDQAQADLGTARWMNYLQDQMNKGARPNAADEPVQKASAELKAAADKGNADAILALGNLQEYTAGPAEARKTYEAGLAKFKGKALERVFQAQIDRLDSGAPAAAEGGKPQAAAPRAGDGDVSARALLMLLIAFQGAGTESGGDKVPEEAGFDFWAAVKLAQASKYADAVKQLDAARAAHDKLRFSRLRKAQNPLSDPTEEIFLRATGEIEAYWTLKSYLAQQGIAGRTPAEIQKSLEARTQQEAAAVAQLKQITDRLKTTPDKAGAAIDALVKQREDAAMKAAALETDLAAARKDIVAAKKEAKDADDKLVLADARLKTVGDRLEAAGVKDADPAKGVDALAAQRAAADKRLDDVIAKLAKANVKVDRKDVLKGVDQVVEAALTNDPKGELMASRDELRRMKTALQDRHSPEQMMDIWLPVLADRQGSGAEPAMAAVDAARVRNDDHATEAAKKKAAAVLGLARRDEGNFEAARTLLAEALAGPGPKAPWQEPAAKALKELTDPNAYYLPIARQLYEEGKYKEAMLFLAQARRLFPKNAGDIQALGSQVQLTMLSDKGKLDPASPGVIEAKRDAELAAATGSAEGHFALGRVNEALGNLAEAKAAYSKALDAHRDNDEAGARYRLALARVLKLQAERPAGRAAAAVRRLPVADARRQPLLTLVLLVELGLQPGAGAAEDEATKLLKEVGNVKDGPDTFLLKAQALALRGLWTPALKTYVTGLRPHVRRDYADTLADLVEHNPALRRPPSLDPPNPLLADVSYASGLRHYFAGRYADAAEAFLKAIEYDDQDARYYYYLGLSRLALDKPAEAAEDFRAGAELELQNRPGREAVSAALERVQGAARQA